MSRRLTRGGLWAVGVLVALWLTLPTLVVIPLSFTGRASFHFPPEEWSLRWYERFADGDAGWLDATVTSLKIALLSALAATALGTAAAIGLHRWASRRSAQALRGLLLLPMIVPGIVIAIGVYALFLKLRLLGTTLGFVCAHAALGVPLVLVTVTASLQALDTQLERAAASLGAGPWVTARRVTLPLIAPGVLSGALFAFMASFDEVVIALFIKSPYLQTLPVQMFASMTRETDPTVAAAATLILLLTSILLVTALLVLGRRTRASLLEAS